MKEIHQLTARLDELEQTVKEQGNRILRLERFKQDLQAAAKKAADAAVWDRIRKSK
jgi:hypothetical protein